MCVFSTSVFFLSLSLCFSLILMFKLRSCLAIKQATKNKNKTEHTEQMPSTNCIKWLRSKPRHIWLLLLNQRVHHVIIWTASSSFLWVQQEEVWILCVHSIRLLFFLDVYLRVLLFVRVFFYLLSLFFSSLSVKILTDYSLNELRTMCLYRLLSHPTYESKGTKKNRIKPLFYDLSHCKLQQIYWV